LRLHFEGPVLVKAPLPPARRVTGNPCDPGSYAEQGLWEADHVFATRAGDNAYYLPGSSLRGVLRSQALRIDEAVGGANRVAPTLFGHLKSNEEVGAKGLIVVNDG